MKIVRTDDVRNWYLQAADLAEFKVEPPLTSLEVFECPSTLPACAGANTRW